jgi:hypothetical protein
MCHLVNDSVESLCNPWHCYYQDWFMGQYTCWMSVRRCCLDLQLPAGHRIQSLERIPLPFFTDNAGKVVVRQKRQFSMEFPHEMDSGKPITTCSVSSLQLIAAATELKVCTRPISSATSAPAISASYTHVLMINQMAETGCGRNFVPGRPGIEYMWPGTRSSVDWRIGWTFSSLTASSKHSCSNSLLIVLRTVLNPELALSGSRTSSPSSTCSRTCVGHW